MGRRARALVLAAAVAVGGVVAVAVPAGAVTGSFAATCVTTGGIHGPLTGHRAIAYEIHAPDSVAPGAVLDVPITFDFAIPANAQVGGAIIDFGGTAQASIVAAPGATEVTGTVRVPTDGPPGSAVPIRIHDLVKEFQRTRRQTGRFGALRTLVTRQVEVTRAVDGISFSVEEGELLGYIGANGAGKSTTIKMLTGILVPTSGEIEVAGLVP